MRRLAPPVVAACVLLGCGGSPSESRRPEAAQASAPGPGAGEERRAPVEGPYTELDAVANAGSIAGTVTLAGPVPKLQPRPITKDNPSCGGTEKPNLSLLLGKGNVIGSAVVSLEGVASGKRFQKSAPLIDQKNCDFVPYLQVAPLGSTLTLVNSDPVSHNIHAWSGNDSLFNVGTPIQGQRVTQTLSVSGAVKFKCDVHPWMFGWVWVARTPYAVATGRDGRYLLDGVPPGTYTLRVWHELFTEKKQSVTVTAGQTTSADVSLSLLD